MAKKKCWIYCRVSTLRQAEEGYSLGFQEEQCRFFAKMHNFEVTKVIKDEGISGKSLYRDGIQEIIETVRTQDKSNKVIDAVFVYALDRLSRSIKDTQTLLELEKEGKYQIVAIKDGLFPTDGNDLNSANRLILTTILSLLNQLYVENLKVRVPAGMEESAKRGGIDEDGNICGKWQGGTVPYGFDLKAIGDDQYEVDSEGNRKSRRKLYINKEEAPVVKLIYEQYLSGEGTYRITKYLNEHGYKTKKGGTWTSKTVGDILKNPLMCGHVSWGKTRVKFENGKVVQEFKAEPTVNMVKGEHEAIVSLEDFEKVQLILKDRRSKNDNFVVDNEGMKRFRRGIKNSHIFSSILTCPECGSQMTGGLSSRHLHNGETIKEVYYKCYNYSSGRLCKSASSLKEDNIKDLIFDKFFNGLTIYVGFLPKLELKSKPENNKEILDIENNINRLSKDLESKKKEVNKTTDLIIKSDGDLSEVFTSKLKELREEQEIIQSNINNLILRREEKIRKILKTFEDYTELKNLNMRSQDNLRKYFFSLDQDKQKDLLESILKKAVISRPGFKKYQLDEVEYNFDNNLVQIGKSLGYSDEEINESINSFASYKGLIWEKEEFIDTMFSRVLTRYSYNIEPARIRSHIDFSFEQYALDKQVQQNDEFIKPNMDFIKNLIDKIEQQDKNTISIIDKFIKYLTKKGLWVRTEYNDREAPVENISVEQKGLLSKFINFSMLGGIEW
jgi:site-specific DNA recombinase